MATDKLFAVTQLILFSVAFVCVAALFVKCCIVGNTIGIIGMGALSIGGGLLIHAAWKEYKQTK